MYNVCNLVLVYSLFHHVGHSFNNQKIFGILEKSIQYQWKNGGWKDKVFRYKMSWFLMIWGPFGVQNCSKMSPGGPNLGTFSQKLQPRSPKDPRDQKKVSPVKECHQFLLQNAPLPCFFRERFFLFFFPNNFFARFATLV